MQIGSLVTYGDSVGNDGIGVILKNHPFMKRTWLIQWTDGGLRFENEVYLEVLCK